MDARKSDEAAIGLGATSHVLDWRETYAWGAVIGSTLGQERRHRDVRAVPREHAVDALAWALSTRFTHVRLYHGCRPTDFKAYYHEGIRRHDVRVIERAWAFFRTQGIPSAALQTALAETDLTLDHGRVFLAFDAEHLIKHSGHYLIYGSESTMAIAATLTRMGYGDTQRTLAQIGKPALFVCEIPMNNLSFETRREIAATLYREHRRARGKVPNRVEAVDHTVVLREDVKAQWIRAHMEPAEITDWHRGGAPYRNRRP